MKKETNDFVEATGAIAESLSLLLVELLKHDFTREEAFSLCRTYLETILRIPNNIKEDNN